MSLNILSLLKKIFEIGKKIIFVLIIYSFIITIFLFSFNKEKPLTVNNTIQNNRLEIYKTINNKKLNSTKEGKIIVKTYRGLSCAMMGEACTDNPEDGDKNFKNSVFGYVANLVVLPYVNPPASGLYWTYSGLQNAGFIPRTYAASGIGFNSLTVFIPIWDAFRKLSYLILVLVIVTIGFMIMFRTKINPQTVISIENALPKIIVTLILITFSYAIVGFLIDIMYLVILVGIDLIGKPLGLDVAYYQKDILISNVFFDYIFSWKNFSIYTKAIYGIFTFLPITIKNILGSLWVVISAIFVIRWLPGFGVFVSQIFGDANVNLSAIFAGLDINVGKIMGAFIALAIVLIISTLLLILAIFVIGPLTLLFLCFRILFLLLSSLIQVILYLIFAPLFILLEAIPGKSSFSSWFKNIVANLSVFPLVIFLIMITGGMTNLYAGNQPVFTPPFLNGFYPQTIAALITGSMLLIIPDLAKLLKQSIIGKGGLELPVGPGTLFGAAGTTVSSIMSGAQQIYYLNTAKSALFGSGQKDSPNYQRGIIGGLVEGVKDKISRS